MHVNAPTNVTHRCPLCTWVGAPENTTTCPACGYGLVAYDITITTSTDD